MCFLVTRGPCPNTASVKGFAAINAITSQYLIKSDISKVGLGYNSNINVLIDENPLIIETSYVSTHIIFIVSGTSSIILRGRMSTNMPGRYKCLLNFFGNNTISTYLYQIDLTSQVVQYNFSVSLTIENPDLITITFNAWRISNA